MATSVASVWPVHDRSASPITRLYRPIVASTLAVVALCRGGLGRSTQDRGCTWRHDDGSVWMMFGDRLVNPVLIVIAVCCEGSDGISDLVEKRLHPRTIIDLFLGHFDGDDFAADGIDGRCAVCARSGVETCRAFQPAIGRLRRASGQCCPPANHRFPPAGMTAPPASSTGGSALNDQALRGLARAV
jgi:hypothetical protein